MKLQLFGQTKLAFLLIALFSLLTPTISYGSARENSDADFLAAMPHVNRSLFTMSNVVIVDAETSTKKERKTYFTKLQYILFLKLRPLMANRMQKSQIAFTNEEIDAIIKLILDEDVLFKDQVKFFKKTAELITVVQAINQGLQELAQGEADCPDKNQFYASIFANVAGNIVTSLTNVNILLALCMVYIIQTTILEEECSRDGALLLLKFISDARPFENIIDDMVNRRIERLAGMEKLKSEYLKATAQFTQKLKKIAGDFCAQCEQTALQKAFAEAIDGIEVEEGKSIKHKKALKVCARCQSSHYCSAECQKAHWPTHKTICKALSSTKKKTESKQNTSKEKKKKSTSTSSDDGNTLSSSSTTPAQSAAQSTTKPVIEEVD